MSPSPTHSLHDPERGAHNLLVGCAEAQAGDSLLLVVEPHGNSHYDPALGPFIAQCARDLGMKVEVHAVEPAAGPGTVPATLLTAIEQSAHTIFLNRIGDQLRFSPLPGRGSKTMCYALDLDFLGSDFAISPYAVWEGIQARLTARLDEARRYTIRCPRGTHLSMDLGDSRVAQRRTGGFTVKNFPVMIVPPVPASALSGRLVLSQALTSTYVHPYDSSILPLPSALTLTLENGAIVRIDGEPTLVERATQQFARVGALFGGPQWAVNSWHAGINAFTYFPRPALDDMDRWSCVAFGSPRYAHFHMCGSAPGDICGQIFDPTISFDDEVLWEEGRPVFLTPEERRHLLTPLDAPLNALDLRRDLGLAPRGAPPPG